MPTQCNTKSLEVVGFEHPRMAPFLTAVLFRQALPLPRKTTRHGGTSITSFGLMGARSFPEILTRHREVGGAIRGRCTSSVA